jgi:ADP-ribose pyrophosphatase YjhB (NUDIX family)
MRRKLLEIADEIRAVATTGLHFATGEFDRERYEKLMRLAARLGGTAADEDVTSVDGIYRGADLGYVTPKIDVRMAVFRGDRVLLIQEREDGRWALPGGYADIGDTPSESAVRETLEEAGLGVRAERLVGVFDRRLQPEAGPHPFHIYKLVFTGSLLDPAAEPRAGSEACDARFFALDALPELSLGRTLPLHIDQALRVAREPDAPPYFD